MDEIKKYTSEIGRRGGLATKKRYGKDHYKEIGKKGGKAKKGYRKDK